MKVKTQAPKPVEEDPAVKAQRLAAEKAAQDAADSSISNTLERKTRLKARVYGTPARVFGVASGPGAGAGGSAYAGSASTASPGSATGADGRAYSFTGFNAGSIWKGGMF